MTEGSWLYFLGALEVFRDPILCAIVGGAALGFVGVHVLLRRMVFATAGLTQGAGLGVALAFFAEIHLDRHVDPALGALVVALGAAALLTLDPRRAGLSREALLALVWLGAAAGAVLVGQRITQEAHDVASVLFGTAVLVRPADLWRVLGAAALVVGCVAWWQRALIFAGADPEGARVQRVPVRFLEVALLGLLTLQVAVTTRALGALPVFAFTVLPGMAALLVTTRLGLVFPLAAVLGAASGLLGYLCAFFLDLPVGASQAAVATGLVLAAFPFGLLRRS